MNACQSPQSLIALLAWFSLFLGCNLAPQLGSAAQPEVVAIISEIEADMAEQLARVREMERNGELEPIPEVSTATQ